MNSILNTSTLSGITTTASLGLTLSDIIQLTIAFGTFLAVLVALFGERMWKWKDRPKISVSFDDNDSECYHLTDMHIHQNNRIIESVPSYYIRIKITNTGQETLNNTEVVLEKIDPKPENFMSLNLSWAGFINASNDITRTVRIPKSQSRILDVIEVMEPSQTAALSRKLIAINDPDAKRYERCSKGFRCCSIKPNTLSDVLSNGKYIFHLGIYADNTKPKFIKLSIKYTGEWGSEGIVGMRKKYLQVKLIKKQCCWLLDFF